MSLSRLVSTPGNHIIRNFYGGQGIDSGYYKVLTLFIPWLGVTTYMFEAIANKSGTYHLYVKLNVTEYGPYLMPYGVMTYISIDHAGTGAVSIHCRTQLGSVSLRSVKIQTGNAEIPYRLVTSYLMPNYLRVAY